PLCGDRIRIQLRVVDDRIAGAGFTADACALCIATASLLTEHILNKPVTSALSIDRNWIRGALAGDPPTGRTRCAMLPVETVKRAVAAGAEGRESQTTQ